MLCKREDLSLDPCYPCGKPGTVAWAYKPSRGKAEMRESLELTGQLV